MERCSLSAMAVIRALEFVYVFACIYEGIRLLTVSAHRFRNKGISWNLDTDRTHPDFRTHYLSIDLFASTKSDASSSIFEQFLEYPYGLTEDGTYGIGSFFSLFMQCLPNSKNEVI